VVRQGLQPCTCFNQRRRQKPGPERLRLSAYWAGRRGLAGHAV